MPILIFIILIVQKAVSQVAIDQYPIEISQFYNISALFNPSLQNQNANWQATAFSKAYTGLLKNNNLSLFNFSTRITNKNSESYHNLGTVLYYDKEGSYLNRYRGYLNYAFSLQLNPVWYASFGASLGVMSYRVGNENFQGGQDNGLDGNLGISLLSKRWNFGVSFLQIPQTIVQPIIEKSILKRYYNVYVEHLYDLSPKSQLQSQLNVNIFTTTNPWLNLHSAWIYDDILSVGAIYKWNKSLGLVIGLEKIKIDKNHIKLYLSYDINISKSYKNNSIELSLRFVRPTDKDKVTKTNK